MADEHFETFKDVMKDMENRSSKKKFSGTKKHSVAEKSTKAHMVHEVSQSETTEEETFRELLEKGMAEPVQHRPRTRKKRPCFSTANFGNTQDMLNLINQAQYGPPVNEFFRMDGLQEKVWRKLRTNHYPHAQALDLHGLSCRESLSRLNAYFRQCCQNGKSHALVVHGKGVHSATNRPVLKNLTLLFLTHFSKTQAFCPAIERNGGKGATFVRIKL